MQTTPCKHTPQVTPGSPAERAGIQPTRRNAAGELVLGDIIKVCDVCLVCVCVVFMCVTLVGQPQFVTHCAERNSLSHTFHRPLPPKP